MVLVEAKERMQRAKIAVQARLKVKKREKEALDDLMRRWSSCMRFAYNRLLEGKERKELKRKLQKIFGLNSRYVDDAILEAQAKIESARELGVEPEKVVFGGRTLFEKLSRRHLSEKERTKLKDCLLYTSPSPRD